jgi:PAS domain S-box-containing protein
MRILLIDDSAVYQEEFEQLLIESGIRFSALDRASDGAEGRRLMIYDLHDIYFIDFRLPGDNGLTLVRFARQSGVVKPIIILTADNRPEVDIAAEQAGANDYLAKGEFTPQMLSRAIRYAVRNAAEISAARGAESRFRMAQEAAEIGAWDWDLREQTLTWSPRMYEIFGLSQTIPAADLYGVWLQTVHPDDRDSAQASATAALAGVAPMNSTYRILRPRPDAKPEVRWISLKGEVLRDPAGSPLRMIGINIDVTEHQEILADLRAEREAAEASRHDSETRFETYFNLATDCMLHMRIAPDGRFVYESANPSALAAIGVTLEQLRGRLPEEILDPEQSGQVINALRQVRATGKPFRCEIIRNVPGGSATYDAAYMPLRDQSGEITGTLAVARDITESRRLEAALHQAYKMEALGQLAGGVAHDFNNVLTGILGCFDLLNRQNGLSDRARRLIVEGLRAADRGKALTKRLLAFSRREPLATERVDVNASIEELSEMLTRSLGAGIRIGKRLSADLWPAVADRNQIELAMMNLAINARDAMPVGGTLSIESRNETITENEVEGLDPGDYVTISIADTGSGMVPDVLAHALEPFFTTKEAGKGTGLGLSMVYGAMRQLGGGLKIASEPGKGTQVTLYLPRAEAETLAAPALPVRFAHGSVSILLIDDDPSTEAMIAAFAAERGDTVVPAESKVEALAILESDQVIDIVVADNEVADPEWIEQVRMRRPLVATLLMSATPEPGGGGYGDVFTLNKPFGRDAFDAAIETAFGGKRTATIIPLRRAATEGF